MIFLITHLLQFVSFMVPFTTDGIHSHFFLGGVLVVVLLCDQKFIFCHFQSFVILSCKIAQQSSGLRLSLNKIVDECFLGPYTHKALGLKKKTIPKIATFLNFVSENCTISHIRH